MAYIQAIWLKIRRRVRVAQLQLSLLKLLQSLTILKGLLQSEIFIFIAVYTLSEHNNKDCKREYLKY